MNQTRAPVTDDQHLRRIALLIDGDNAEPSKVAHILAEVARFGTITVRRVYGDWTTPQMSSWKSHLQGHAVQPIQQFRYTTGKNATDSSLIIDAMDLLHSGTVDGFCVASSDSDFTRLATRIREHGFFVMGVGRQHTPPSFVNACEVFVYTENLGPKEFSQDDKKREGSEPADWARLISESIDATTGDSDVANLASVGAYVRTLDPAFDPRRHGFKKLSELIASRPDLFEVFETQDPGKPPILSARCMPKATSEEPSRKRAGPRRSGRLRHSRDAGAATRSRGVRKIGSGIIGKLRKPFSSDRDAHTKDREPSKRD
ncbi:MAG: NYN domain-containing protein [Bryobacterales bacterium]|nr:NYN domain-containing protein [Bryobacterales bacterium]